MKVIVNRCFGGYGWSLKALDWMIERRFHPAMDETKTFPGIFDGKDRVSDSFYLSEVPRSDPLLIECLETLGSEVASAPGARLAIVEIPDDVQWHIEEYDGMEHVAENHRTW